MRLTHAAAIRGPNNYEWNFTNYPRRFQRTRRCGHRESMLVPACPDQPLTYQPNKYEALRRVHLIPSEDHGQDQLDIIENANVFRDLDSPVSEGGDNFSTG